MKPLNSKLKPVELKLTVNTADLDKFHPIRDLDTNFLINQLEKEHKARTLPLIDRLKLRK